MKSRCYNKNQDSYKYYGEKGVIICDEWLSEDDGFLNFYNWSIENKYSDNLSIDRIDPDDKYSPENCRWADDFIQANNHTNNHLITYKGITKNMKQWSEELGITYSTLANRLNTRKWSIERALETPIKNMNNRKKDKNGKR